MGEAALCFSQAEQRNYLNQTSHLPRKFKPKCLDTLRIPLKTGKAWLEHPGMCMTPSIGEEAKQQNPQSLPIVMPDGFFMNLYRQTLRPATDTNRRRKSTLHKSLQATHPYMIVFIQEFSISSFW